MVTHTHRAAAQLRFEADKNLAALGFCSLNLLRWADGAFGNQLVRTRGAQPLRPRTLAGEGTLVSYAPILTVI
jgi:hypothetical protein